MHIVKLQRWEKKKSNLEQRFLLGTRAKLGTLFPCILVQKKFKKIPPYQLSVSTSTYFFQFLGQNLNPSLQVKNSPKMLCKNSEKDICILRVAFQYKIFLKIFFAFFPKSYLRYKIAKMYGKRVCPIKITALQHLIETNGIFRFSTRKKAPCS
jgi:hypothetical protein